MLKRKIRSYIHAHLASRNSKILVIDGASQIGKSYIIRDVATSLFQNYVEINFAEDKNGPRLFEAATTKEEFYFRLSTVAGEKLRGTKDDTIIFLDEIQAYPHLLTLLKFLKEDGRYTYIASGFLLGVTLRQTTSVPDGSVIIKHMYQLDFEEFLWANGFTQEAVSVLEQKFLRREPLDESMHGRMMYLFKKYLLVGGLPDAVNEYLSSRNIVAVRDIEEKKSKRNEDYQDEFDYIAGAGIAIEVKAVSSPVFPLKESESKNLLKFYMNDVGLLTNELYKYNIDAVMNDRLSVNLGSVYESVVASELRAHCSGPLFYYDNKAHGEVEFLLDDYDHAAILPVEVKSGKDYTIHRALNAFLANPDYHVHDAYVLSNERLIKKDRFITYLPIYFSPFIRSNHPDIVTL